MKITKKITERCLIRCTYEEEDQAVQYLIDNKYTHIDFYHTETEVRITGSKREENVKWTTQTLEP